MIHFPPPIILMLKLPLNKNAWHSLNYAERFYFIIILSQTCRFSV